MENIRELLEYCVNEYSDHPAIKWPDHGDVKAVTFDELSESAALVRRALASEGFKDDHIAIIG